jgi:hypothetical protein
MDEQNKGYYGVDYRTVLGLNRSVSGGSEAARRPGDPSWDIWVGPLPFLLGNNAEAPYLRESAPVRRDRFDQARDPGDNSLDSSLWIRSWTSWHLGAGQEWAEPLELDPDIARFRYWKSAGIDPFSIGQVTLLHSVTQRRTGVRSLTAHPKHGVLASSEAGVRKITATTDTQLSSQVGTSITVSADRWYMITDTGVVRYGSLAGGGEGQIATITGATSLQVAKDRLWVGAGKDLYEITAASAGSQTPFHTFTSGTIIDIDTGAGGLYVMVDDGMTYIYVISANADGTLSPPVEVAVLPRGETGTMLYGYLSRYMVVGTNLGVRVADCSTPESLTVGPIAIEIEGGCKDAAANSNFMWVTGGTEKIDVVGDGSDMRPGLYRMDLSRQTQSVAVYGDNAAGAYPYSTDLYSTGVESRADALTVLDGVVYFSCDGVLYMRNDEYVTQGWIDLGKVNFSTAEEKAWQSVVAKVSGIGAASVFANTGAGYAPVTQSALKAPFSGDARIDTFIHPSSGWISLRAVLYGDGVTTPVGESLGVRAIPVAKRTRYVRIPLQAYDHEVDRHNSPVGYDGFAYDRLKDLEDLEESGAIIRVQDNRTGETLFCQIDKVNFANVVSPDRSRSNWGGLISLTLLSV